mmetsp:Transcript_154738/g.475394  ORF Transcript_154738/g.475394 Transcript_154738/m.475394 type:complete len:221 (+) Transcript_154738:211-873(+)
MAAWTRSALPSVEVQVPDDALVKLVVRLVGPVGHGAEHQVGAHGRAEVGHDAVEVEDVAPATRGVAAGAVAVRAQRVAVHPEGGEHVAVATVGVGVRHEEDVAGARRGHLGGNGAGQPVPLVGVGEVRADRDQSQPEASAVEAPHDEGAAALLHAARAGGARRPPRLGAVKEGGPVLAAIAVGVVPAGRRLVERSGLQLDDRGEVEAGLELGRQLLLRPG